MQPPSDQELLQRYVKHRCENSFAELVRRHLDMVWGAAWRITSDADLARDVSQTVFTDFASKARSITSHENLSGWLYRAATHAARNTLRANLRRQQREKQAMQLENPNSPDPADDLLPLLDEALSELAPQEREVLLMRFFSKKSFAQIGQAFSLSEDAAQKRASRALDHLRTWFNAKGATLTTTSAAALLTTASTQAAPANLAASIAFSATATATTLTSTGTFLTLMNSKLALAATAAVVAIPLFIQHQSLAREQLANDNLRHSLAARKIASPPAEQSGPDELAEIEKLRAEISSYSENNTVPDRPELTAAREELQRAREKRQDLEAEIQEAAYRAKTLNAMKLIGLAARLFENDRKRFPTNFNEMTAELGPKPPGGLSLDLFELVKHDMPISEVEPSRIFAKEKTPRLRKDGKYERAYVRVDGSAQMLASPTPDFSQIEQQMGMIKP